MKQLQFVTILFGTLFILLVASTGMDFFNGRPQLSQAEEFYAPDPNDPNGKPIKLNGTLESYDVSFPKIDGEDVSKDAISRTIRQNIRTGSALVLGILYERLAYLEFRDGNFDNARLAYNSALDFYVQDNQRLRMAELLSQLAHLEAKTKNYDTARKLYKKSAGIFSMLNETVRSDYTLKIADRLPSL